MQELRYRLAMRVLILSLLLATTWTSGCGSSVPTHSGAVDPAPLAWPARIADLRWLEGRWISDAPGEHCVVEHWLYNDTILWGTRLPATGGHGAFRLHETPGERSDTLTLLDVSSDALVEFQSVHASAQMIRFARHAEANDVHDASAVLNVTYARTNHGLTVTTVRIDGTQEKAQLSPAADAAAVCP
jgi:hypothetical protein